MNCKIFTSLVFVLVALVTAGARQEQRQETLTVSFPGKPWGVAIDAPGFVVQTEERKPDGREYLLAHDEKTGIVLSVTLEKSAKGADAKTCPDYLQKRLQGLSQLGLTDVKTSEVHSMAVIEYLIPQAGGVPVQQKNLVACAAKDDVYVDIHLSKVKFQPSDESLFTDVLTATQLVDLSVPANGAPSPQSKDLTTPGVATSVEYFQEGSRRFLARDYSGAIGPYQKALDLEKKRPQLSKTYWFVLVDNLGMAYGISGDLDHAEETFNYGLTKAPNYPMFYYNLACTYAERKNMDQTMDYLQKAFALKANSLPGESMPDPREDDSFQPFMSNEGFRKLVDSLVASPD